MKSISFYLLTLLLIGGLYSCSEFEPFDYSREELYGTWDGTAVKVNNQWIDITSYYYRDFQFSITFYEDGTYYGNGYFGTGHGTYKAYGSTIETYLDRELYFIYHVKSLTNNEAELSMTTEESTSSIEIRVKKR